MAEQLALNQKVGGSWPSTPKNREKYTDKKMFNFPWITPYTQDDEDDERDDLDTLMQGLFEYEDDTEDENKEVAKPEMHWRKAYEENKTRDNCVLCKKPTVEVKLFSSSIMACKCIDELAKKENK